MRETVWTMEEKHEQSYSSHAIGSTFVMRNVLCVSRTEMKLIAQQQKNVIYSFVEMDAQETGNILFVFSFANSFSCATNWAQLVRAMRTNKIN